MIHIITEHLVLAPDDTVWDRETAHLNAKGHLCLTGWGTLKKSPNGPVTLGQACDWIELRAWAKKHKKARR
jgi:hypothetical protein